MLVHRLDLQLGDAIIDVSDQAASPPVATDPLDQAAVVGVKAEQLERALSFGGRLLPEDEPRADQVLDLADVGQLLGARISVAFSARPSRFNRSINRRPSRDARRNHASSKSTTLCTDRSPLTSRIA